MKKIKIAQFGLGPIGLETLKLAATKPWAEIVGGIDIDPAKLGMDLGELTQDTALAAQITPATMTPAPISCLTVNGSPKTGTEIIITPITSRCDTAKAGLQPGWQTWLRALGVFHGMAPWCFKQQ